MPTKLSQKVLGTALLPGVLLWSLALWGLVLLGTSTAQEPAEKRLAREANSNSLIREHRKAIVLSNSSSWSGWPADRAFDENPKTSWFTARGDAAALGTKPWIAAEFPADVTVKRITLLSNREPPWENGYTILVGRLELLDGDGVALFSRDDELGGERADMDVRLKAPLAKVRKIRFTSLRDEGDQNPYDDIAIGEILVE